MLILSLHPYSDKQTIKCLKCTRFTQRIVQENNRALHVLVYLAKYIKSKPNLITKLMKYFQTLM